MKVAIHQPNYLPWMGYFYKMWLCDSFVFLDHIVINKSGYTRRTSIALNDRKDYLTVPLTKFRDGTLISHLKIDQRSNWPDYHMSRLYNQYYNAPYISAYWKSIDLWYKRAIEFETLASWNIFLINNIAELLSLSLKTVKSSELIISSFKDEMNAEVVQILGGEVYISGKTGLIYRNEHAYIERNIEVFETDLLRYITSRSEYGKSFDPTLSIIDALFNVGTEGILKLFQECYGYEFLQGKIITELKH